MILWKINKYVLNAIVLLLLVGCSSMLATQEPTPDSNYYALDPVFRELYTRLGGKAVLGEVISEVHESRGVKKQYVVAGLLIFDANAPESSRFQFGKLAQELGVLPAPDSTPGVAEPFQDIHRSMGGEPFIGSPMTDLIYNAENNRYEQYFESLGFYMGQETDGEIKLLPYGLWMCGEYCRQSAPLNSLPELPLPTQLSRSFEMGDNPQSSLPTQPRVETTAVPPQNASSAAAGQLPSEWTIVVWENAPRVPIGQAQNIGIIVFEENVPAEGIVLDLELSLPDGQQQKLQFPPTDPNGYTRLQIPPITAANGAVIFFRVCMAPQISGRYCVAQSFEISEN